MNEKRFDGRVAIVTGGGSGIGAAVAEKLAEQGAKMVVVFGRRLNRLQNTVDKIGSERCTAMSLDVSDETAVKGAIDEIFAKYGRIDILANMAGTEGPTAPIHEYSYDEFKKIYATNVFGTFLTMKHCIPIMHRQHSGAIVNTASCSGVRYYGSEIAYGSSKHAVAAMSLEAAAENGKTGVRINAISPGWVKTEMMDLLFDQFGGEKYVPFYGTMDRASTPEEMANCVCFLLSDEASYVNGCNFICDGGYTL